MPGATKISWTDQSWNPTTGCTKVSKGCDHCYAETFAERWRGVSGHAYEQGFDLRLWPERLNWPVTNRKPWQLCFVNSMSDLFHVGVPDTFRLDIFDAMRRAGDRSRTFQVLTKRADHMERWMRRLQWTDGEPWLVTPALRGLGVQAAPPLPNIWLGVSVEDQTVVARAQHLLRTPAAVRFLSIEPMLGPVDLSSVLSGAVGGGGGQAIISRTLGAIGWVIIGGESGAGARPMELGWMRAVIAQCREAGVPVFVKQLGAVWARATRSASSKGEIVEEWPEDLRIHEWPSGFTRILGK